MTFPALAVTYLELTAIIWARYIIIAGLFYFLLWGRPEDKVGARRLADRRPEAKTVRHEITMSLASSAIYAAPGAIVFEMFRHGGTAIYAGPINGVMGWLYLPVSVFIYLMIHDTYFYWTHRLMHHPKLFRATHLAHHRSRQPTPWAAFSFHPWEAIISAWILPAAALFIPIHVGAVLFVLVFMTYCSVANHAGWEIVPERWVKGLFGAHFISASHHNVHHTNYNANYGLYFRFWDLLMKTDEGVAEPIRAK
ncbi:sterol desaturase family protein [Marinicaulis aureus]|uniref:Sterol desaturase family protein n=1 Tax=Hyphococcus aureus TaxID=2666033 RepID=A0ABW1KZT0_9PROT